MVLDHIIEKIGGPGVAVIVGVILLLVSWFSGFDILSKIFLAVLGFGLILGGLKS